MGALPLIPVSGLPRTRTRLTIFTSSGGYRADIQWTQEDNGNAPNGTLIVERHVVSSALAHGGPSTFNGPQTPLT